MERRSATPLSSVQRLALVAAVAVAAASVLWSLSDSLQQQQQQQQQHADAPRSRCNVETALSCEAFVARYAGKEPVVLRGVAALANPAFRAATELAALARGHGDLPLKLSTANAFTGREWAEMSLREYMATTLRPQNETRHGNQTLYLFGSQFGAAWDAFLAGYTSPATVFPSETFLRQRTATETGCARAALLAQTAAGTTLSFGLSGRGTGVPFHFHGPGFLQMLHGRKRWFLYPPGADVQFDPNQTTLAWTRQVLPELSPAQRPSHDCVLEPGDVIYFPSEWMHATLNLDDYTCFIATFA